MRANDSLPRIERQQDRSALPKPFPSANPSLETERPVVQSTFVENKGQWDARVKFQLKGGGKTLWLTDTGIVFDKVRPTAPQSKATENTLGRSSRIPLPVADQTAAAIHNRLVFCEDFVGATVALAIEPIDAQPGEYNYLTGGDPKNWHTGVRGYSGVIYRNVWDGIDVKLTRNGTDIEQEFVVHPGADLSRVQIAYRGIDGLSTTEDGSLEISTAFGKLRETQPRIYQEIHGGRVMVGGHFKLLSAISYTFAVGAYDAEYAMVVDPTLLYSTFLGGSAGNNPYGNNTEFASGIAVDASGNAYITGYTASSDFPVTSGAFNTSAPYGGTFITKLDPTGSSLVYSTYLDGAANPAGISVDPSGNAYVAGTVVTCGVFPITANAYSQSCGYDYLTVLNAGGTGIIYSTAFAGYDSQVNSMALGTGGRVYMTGSTGGSIPTTANGYQTSYVGVGSTPGPAAFGMAFDTTASGNASLVYSTFFQVNNPTTEAYGSSGKGIAVDAYGNFYVTGYAGENLPVTPGAYQSSLIVAFGACRNPYGAPLPYCPDGFVAKFNPSQSGTQSLIYSTYLGGSGLDEPEGIAIDNSGNAYLTGVTLSNDFPVTSGAFQTVGLATGPTSQYIGFVSKLNPGGSGLVYSTYLEATSSDIEVIPTAIVVDVFGNAYVTGLTNSTAFPVTSDAYQGTFGGPNHDFSDAFLTKFTPDGSKLVYSSYLGGTGEEVAYGVAVDQIGDAYIAGLTSSFDFPVTGHAFQPAMHGTGDAFVTKFPLGASGTLSVSSLTPSSGGNSGTASPQIFGTGFHDGATAKLNCAGQSIVGTNLIVGPGGRFLNATFNLAGLLPGSCDVVVTNTDGSSATLPQAFTIQQGGSPNYQVYLTGVEARKVPGEDPVGPASAVMFATVSNTGSVDSEGGVISLSSDDPFALTSANPAGLGDVTQGSADDFEVWTSGPIAAGSSQTFTVTEATSQSPICDPDAPHVNACFYPYVNCRVDGVQMLGCLAANGIVPTSECGIAIAGCFGGTLTGAGVLACIYAISKCGIDERRIVDGCRASSEICDRGAPICISDQLPCVQPNDPNSMVGPSGVGGERWITGPQPLTYVISFNNEPSASAPAQQVIVTEPLGPNFNLKKLTLPSMTLPDGGIDIQVPIPPLAFNPGAGVNEFKTNVDLRPTQNLLVAVDVLLNPTTQTLTWTLTSIDPATGQPPLNPLIGFLPPGAGASLSFSAIPIAGLATGSAITEQATIVFDGQAPMSTQTWLNTIDNTPPISQVAALPPTETAASFKIQWSGTDQGSGIQDYTIYASDSGGPFIAFLVNTAATSASFTGEAGHTYGFYSIARDLVGNVENPKTAAEATTQATEGGAPTFTLAPASLNFGSVIVGSTTASKTVKLTHKGPTVPTLAISSVTTSGDYSQTNDCPGILNSGTSCTLTVTFSPNVAGVLNGALSVYDSFSSSPQVVTLTGTGLAPISAKPVSLKLSSPVGSTSTPGIITVANGTVADVSVSYGASASFSAAPGSSNGCGSVVAAHSNCTLAVTFTPDQPGTIYGSLTVTGAFPTQVVDLTGTATGGTGPTLGFTPAKLIFKTPEAIGTTSAPLTVTVTNKGASAVAISGLSASPGFAVAPSGTKPCSGSLAAKAKCTFQVTFTPSVTGLTEGSISVANDGAINPVLYDVSGTGVNVVSFAPASLTFSAQTVGTTSDPKTVTFSNNQSVSLNIASIVASGDYSAVPGGTNPCGSAVAANSSCTFVVSFTPTKIGTIKGAVTVTDDAPTSPQVISLNGKGQ
jgi:hypothetical protein